jgi:hypothetical protein
MIRQPGRCLEDCAPDSDRRLEHVGRLYGEGGSPRHPHASGVEGLPLLHRPGSSFMARSNERPSMKRPIVENVRETAA